MDYKDINCELCIKCGECCKIFFPVRGDDRYFRFLDEIGVKVIRDGVNNARVDYGYCPHLIIKDSLYICEIYNNRPDLCRDYNCLAWANYTNSKDKSEFLARALKIYDEISINC